MSVLRARCPWCRTLTAVAVGDGYECHSCGALFPVGLVRVPRAWGNGGAAMAEAASLGLALPEATIVDEGSLASQTEALAVRLPRRPVVLGGCCCAHVGAVEGLVARPGRLGLVWIDAHGDLNTPDSSPSRNAWGMPLRMLLDSGAVRIEDTVLVGARDLDPPEQAFIEETGLPTGPEAVGAVLDRVDRVYVAFDIDVLDPGEPVAAFLPVPGGISLAEAEHLLASLVDLRPIAGAGFTSLAPDPRNAEAIERLCTALGLL